MAATDFDIEWAEPYAWAAMYRSRGLQVVPAGDPAQGANWKRPILNWEEFQNTLTPAATFNRWYDRAEGQHRARGNMGLIMGRASGGVFCVDLDLHKKDGLARQWWADLLAENAHGQEPMTPAQRTGGGGRHILFRAPEGWMPPTFKTPVGIDIRGQGGFMMSAPSRHESGKDYEWEAGREVWSLEPAEAPEWLVEAIERVREDHGHAPGSSSRQRTESANKYAAEGIHFVEVDDREERMFRSVWGALCDLRREYPANVDAPFPPDEAAAREAAWGRYLEKVGSRLTDPSKTKEELLNLEGRGRIEFDRKWKAVLKKWDGKLRDAAGEPKPGAEKAEEPAADEGAEKSSDGSAESASGMFDPWEEYPVPAFPMDCLPRQIASFVEFQAKVVGADTSGIAMAVLAAASGALDHRFTLKLKRSGDWFASPRLWVMLVGASSAMKSPVIRACLGPLWKLEADANRAHAKDLARFLERKADGEKEQPPPDPIRYICDDTTPESVGVLMTKQDRGILTIQDEMGAFIGGMEKYGGKGGASAGRGFWLQAYNGGPRRVDRISRGSQFIENCSSSFLGGVQPRRLREMGDLSSDGLLQRFLPVMMAKPTFGQEAADDGITETYRDTIGYLTFMPPTPIVLSDEALDEFNRFRRAMFDLEQLPGLGDSFSSFVGKLAGVHGSIMLLLHVLVNPKEAPYEPVELRTALAASKILETFIIPHALALYQESSDRVDWEVLRKMSGYVLTSEKDRFVPSDFTSGVRSMRGASTFETAQKVSHLVAGGWLKEEEGRGGAPAWCVVQGLREALSERRAQQLDEQAKTLAALQNLRKGNHE